jgi:hypothetical protein
MCGFPTNSLHHNKILGRRGLTNYPLSFVQVTSKPDLYPLVITCGEGEGKAGGNYLMVHYFRNYVIRAPGKLYSKLTEFISSVVRPVEHES